MAIRKNKEKQDDRDEEGVIITALRFSLRGCTFVHSRGESESKEALSLSIITRFRHTQ
jgi:hypothetical protein